MTIAHICLFIAVLLPAVCAGLSKAGAFGLSDNRDPRHWQAQQTGWRARAVAAQANGFEALPWLIAGLFVASQRGTPQPVVDGLASAFVGLRLVYIALYLADLATLRSLAWIGSVVCAAALFFAGG